MLQVENQFNMMLVVGFYMLQVERSLQYDASYARVFLLSVEALLEGDPKEF
jgi:hypothetical protein